MFLSILLVTIVVGAAASWEIKVDPDPGEKSIYNRKAGDPFAVLCSVEGLAEDADAPGIFWSKNPDSISRTGNVQLNKIDKFALSLVIPNSSVEDSGIYTCTVTYHGERREVRLEINFFAEIKLIETQTDFFEPKEGTSIILSCEVITSDNELITMWEKDITALTESSERGYKFHRRGQILEIKSYMESDAGNYNCKVLDKRTGSMVLRRFRVGSRIEEQQQFCSNMCQAFCASFYSPNK
ncbi:unnamed protein product [Bursaphelenchus xylophilus]|uniref:(pine wood nematode) hypothetical protein n=1 Tax=Bursaphelenchus xylophilus TaxID=6326 RepID=A0A7I8XDU1_BURXY|nr:unnamed protein product [Bursaphelenchus xylophilus]CAG9113493.1 unnamed protein product [Bursaphelenchus xylophilus]